MISRTSGGSSKRRIFRLDVEEGETRLRLLAGRGAGSVSPRSIDDLRFLDLYRGIVGKAEHDFEAREGLKQVDRELITGYSKEVT